MGTSSITRVYYVAIATLLAAFGWISRTIEAALLLLPARRPLAASARDLGPRSRLHNKAGGATVGR
ncbi:hypothetical protein [Streptomyces europaeiscabiei]|uniref:hypothetical protein n=1 Tax=Streptomyces europaeiscabiei TaxID=146819 RepID=UPI0013C3E5F7|nr:hypothetical protein [Streptomyces europaeiscabiei]